MTKENKIELESYMDQHDEKIEFQLRSMNELSKKDLDTLKDYINEKYDLIKCNKSSTIFHTHPVGFENWDAGEVYKYDFVITSHVSTAQIKNEILELLNLHSNSIQVLNKQEKENINNIEESEDEKDVVKKESFKFDNILNYIKENPENDLKLFRFEHKIGNVKYNKWLLGNNLAEVKNNLINKNLNENIYFGKEIITFNELFEDPNLMTKVSRDGINFEEVLEDLYLYNKR